MLIQHNFELTMLLDSEKFSKLLNSVYDKSNGEFYTDNDKYVDNTLASKGITVTYLDNPNKKKVKLTVNPNRIIGDDEINPDGISRLLRKLENRIHDYFNSEYMLNDFKLSRMGLMIDIDVHERKKVAAYIKIFQRIGKVKNFSPSNNSWLDNDISFCLNGNSNGIEFMIYDLEKMAKDQLIETEPKRKMLKYIAEKTEGIIRAEVWLIASKAFQGFTDETVTSELIADLLKSSEKIFLNTFLRIIPYGDCYKKGKAMEMIRSKVTDKTMRRKMLRLLALIPEKKSLLLAQKALNYRKIGDVMYEFFTIGISPVTISKRLKAKYLKNLYEFM